MSYSSVTSRCGKYEDKFWVSKGTSKVLGFCRLLTSSDNMSACS